MFESLSGFFSAAFLSKWAFLAGGLLVSAPIIIHLINRMRFKRIRWAAMEFLLKAQKKMKRKMVIEQLLLLILRILLMLLIGLLIARFSGFDMAGKDNRATYHLVLVDDSPSTADRWKPAADQPEIDAIGQARKVVTEQIVPAVGKAPTAQYLDVALTSRPGEPRTIGRVGTDTGAAGNSLDTYLKNVAPSTVRADLAAVLRSAKDTLQKQSGPDKSQVLYLVSDMRANDWAEQGEAVRVELEELKKAGVVVHLIDVTGDPYRRLDVRAPRGNDNIGIVELVPSKPIVARGESVEFKLKVRNFGVAPVENARFAIKVNGDDDKGRSVAFGSLAPGQVSEERFELYFDEVGTDPRLLPDPLAVFTGTDKEVEALFKRFSVVTASLDTPERGGIPADNVRHAVVEVREKLPVLVVDGAKANLRPGEKIDGHFVYLNQFFANATGSGFAVTEAKPVDLDGLDLSRFALLLLLDVPALSDAGTKNVEAFIRNGGGCGIFLGADVKPQDYNKRMYRDGAGFFPVALPDGPTPEPTADQLLAMQLKVSQQKFLLRDSKVREHPALAGLYLNERGQPLKPAEEIVRWSQFITVKQYYKLDRNGPWRDDKSVTELYCMPNEGAVAEYADAVKGVRERLTALLDDPDMAKFRKPVTDTLRGLNSAVFNDQLGLGGLAMQFDRLLADGRTEGDPNEPLLREFWAHPKAGDLRRDVARLRDRVKFGDPLYLAKTFGRGRVTLFLTSANESWTDWPSSQPANFSFIPVVKEMVTYLSGGGGAASAACGVTIAFDLPAGGKDSPVGYVPRVREAFVTVTPKMGQRNNDAVKVTFEDRKERKLVEANGVLPVSRTDTDKPGVYYFGLVQSRPTADGQADLTPELRAVAVNVDTREGDLRRVTTDDLDQHTGRLPIHSPEDAGWTDALQNKKSDLSEAGWVFLALLLVLVCEQALAVRLSRQGTDESLARTAPTVAAATARRAPVVTADTAA